MSTDTAGDGAAGTGEHPATVFFVHSAGTGIPAWAAVVGARELSAGRLTVTASDEDTESVAKALATAGCALLDASVPGFVAIARRLHALNANVQAVAVAAPEMVQATRRALLYAPGLGEVWLASPTDITAAFAERAAGVTRQRRQFERTRARLERGRLTESPQRAARALVSDAYLAGLLRVLPDSVFSVDSVGRILSVNEAGERLFGGVGRPLLLGAKLVTPLQVEGWPTGDEAILLAGAERAGKVEVRFRTSEGTARVGELRAAPVVGTVAGTGGGATLAAAGVWAVLLQDVTEAHAVNDQLREAVMELELQAEELEAGTEALLARTAEAEEARAEAEAANRAKRDFLAVMSHELRTPLNAIGGYAELIALGIRGPVTDEQRHDLARIRQSQHHLLGLINEVLNYAKLEMGSVRYEVTDVPLAQVLTWVEPLIAPQLATKALAYTHQLCGETLAVARADRDKVRQILLNLLSNAIKFTPANGRIEVSCVTDADRVSLHVQDTGIGIAPELVDRIFEPFVQVDARLTRVHEGTGLGLAISRDLARGMGGDLTAESAIGVGSTFTLALPAA